MMLGTMALAGSPGASSGASGPSYRPHGWEVTVPSGCSHVMVPLDVTDGCDGVPLTICSNIICVQSYLTRPCVAPSSNRRHRLFGQWRSRST